jgi:hypothetical protein
VFGCSEFEEAELDPAAGSGGKLGLAGSSGGAGVPGSSAAAGLADAECGCDRLGGGAVASNESPHALASKAHQPIHTHPATPRRPCDPVI